MDIEKYRSGRCPVGRALARIGDSWSMLILRDASQSPLRFEAARANLGIAPNILTRRLTMLVADGLLEKRAYSTRPPRFEYVLTDKGADVVPILMAIGAWGRKYHGEGGTSYIVDESGAPIEPLVVNARSGKPLSPGAMRIVQP
ncbi:helix-turn-helix transcriptional regulator [Sphingomonas psychrotolerans]|uniref:Helix-turn-helix transcriptional regulator n=1 Tax=Sphingomonas psychrotolerans TaxID=1327635 RepID=A0ABU3N5Q5_9SPHN|nr:helix-turn-helix domain-containing protein [Sphingomonas psychrotolerans]MDT8759798.1 helix-turn-helix transcriptional regulator [Sphingomonas psychrotolerans]